MKTSLVTQLTILALLVAAQSFQNPFQHQVFLQDPQLVKDYELHRSNLPQEDLQALQGAWKELLELPVPYLKGILSQTNMELGEKQSLVPRPEPVFAAIPPQLPNEEFEVLTHEQHDNYQLRIKKNGSEKLKLDTVKLYAGYLDVRDVDKHFFYWFYESRNDPKTDPIVLWINGGPGCVSECGLLFELGPSFIDSDLKPVYNPSSWNSNASVIFLDQPVGVGYSYAGNEDVDTSAKSAKDVYVFLELFFKKFPDFLNNKFHISGESYGGHYLPHIGNEIISHPERSFELQSVLIGNGAVDMPFQGTYNWDMLCDRGGLDVLTEEQCQDIKPDMTKCSFFSFICDKTDSILSCVPARYYCEKAYAPLREKNLNPYDLRRPCENDHLCYNDMDYVADFMNLNSTKSTLGVPSELKFESCKREVGERFGKANDPATSTQELIGKILDYGIPVLFYAGDKDFVCHWIGFNEVSNLVPFEDHESYEQSVFMPWLSSSGEQLGEVRGFGNFTFLRVYESGHMVPHDQPGAALEMFNTWISGDISFGY